MNRRAIAWLTVGFATLLVSGGPLRVVADEKTEFFERKIRPVLVQHCYKCHSGEAADLKGELRLDSRPAIRTGGASGPAVVPGDVEKSLLWDAISHRNGVAKMPPAGKLPDSVLADFRRWIADGATDPRDKPSGAALDWQQVLAGRKAWWSWQPVTRPNPPDVKDRNWSPQPIDRFLQARWEASGLSPAAEAEPTALIRRLSFVLTGLPPTPEEVASFTHEAATARGAATARLVDRLLASPRFGEQWARHWMDLVRYGETYGSEHDPLLPHAYRYRDYLIRAFNDDVPYDRLLREHLAGDLLPPRWNRAQGVNESLLGTMFFHLVEFYPTPVDPKAEEMTVVESQIDTFGKAFQGLTIACARCHDHKFDAVSAADYYALYGIFASGRATMLHLDDPATIRAHDAELAATLPAPRQGLAELWRGDVSQFSARTEAARLRLKQGGLADKLANDSPQADRDAFAFKSLVTAKAAHSPLIGLAGVVVNETSSNPVPLTPQVWEQGRQAWTKHFEERSPWSNKSYHLFADMRTGIPSGWTASQPSYRAATSATIAPSSTGDTLVTGVYPRGAYSHLLSDKHGGALRSASFPLDMEFVSALVVGTNGARARLVVENFQGIDLLFQRSNLKLTSGSPEWFTVAIRPQWKGLRGYFEVVPRDDMTYAGRVSNAASLPTDGRSGAGVIAVVFHNGSAAPTLPAALPSEMWDASPTVAGQLGFLKQQTRVAIEAFAEEKADDRQALLLDGLLRAGWLSNRAPADHSAAIAVKAYREVEQRVPVPRRVPGVIDGDGRDERLFPRGDYKAATDPVPRRYLEVLHGAPYRTAGSGRLQLANELTSPTNPLTARVMVNRLWHYVFGAGLVRTVDNFGQLGETPSHPELLDYLASRFVEKGWSIKQLLREMLLSRAFQLSTEAAPRARESDADNRLWSHAMLRRLEAESLRDTLLAISGRLDETMYGLGVPLPVPKAYKDFDIPQSGPLDGNGRRSIYLEQRRNYPLPLLLVFDQPRPMLCVGRRDVTNVPAQSLALLNDPFVWQQAEQFSQRVLAERHDTTASRIGSLYRRALGREPSPGELSRSQQFLTEQSRLLSPSATAPSPLPSAWRDLAHALFNRKEFLYVR